MIDLIMFALHHIKHCNASFSLLLIYVMYYAQSIYWTALFASAGQIYWDTPSITIQSNETNSPVILVHHNIYTDKNTHFSENVFFFQMKFNPII